MNSESGWFFVLGLAFVIGLLVFLFMGAVRVEEERAYAYDALVAPEHPGECEGQGAQIRIEHHR